ncbi:MAG: hypothetical protein Q9187_006053 [Circinaria calcarea]
MFFSDPIYSLNMMSTNESSSESNLAARYKAEGFKFPGGYSIEDLYDLGLVEYAKARPNNLKGPIHSILDIPKWRQPFSKVVRGPWTKEDDEAMVPILRLATALLLSPGSVAFVHALMYGRQDYQSELSQRHKKHISVLRDSQPPTARIREEFEKGLSELVPHVRFNWGNIRDPLWKSQGSYGQTYAKGKPDMQFNGTNGINMGSSSSIVISDVHYRPLLKVHGKPQSCQVRNQMLRLQLVLATTICHELIHAVHYAVTPLDTVEPFYKHQGVNELGYAWEDEVFGGIVSELDKKLEWPLDVSRFPRPYHYTYVWTQEDEYDPQNQMNFARDAAPLSLRLYYVPMKWLSRLVRQNTWDRWSSSEDPKLLHIPKTVGVQREYSRFTFFPEKLRNDTDYTGEDILSWTDMWDQYNWSEEDLPGDMTGRLYQKVEKEDSSVSDPDDGQDPIQEVIESTGGYQGSSEESTDKEGKSPEVSGAPELQSCAASPGHGQGLTASMTDIENNSLGITGPPEEEIQAVVPGSPGSRRGSTEPISDGEDSPLFVGMRYNVEDSPIYVGRDYEEDETMPMDTGDDLGSREQPILIEESDSDAMDYEEDQTGRLISFTEASHDGDDGTGYPLSHMNDGSVEENGSESSDEESGNERFQSSYITKEGYYIDENGNVYV